MALLTLKGLEPDWIEATGTWFGAVATVLALLWAVQTFRADQADRDRAREEEATERIQLVEAQARDVEKQAGLVTIRVRGGGGFGNAPEMRMNTVRLEITNDSRQPARVMSIELLPPLLRTGWKTDEITIPPTETYKSTLQVEEFPADEQEFSGAPMPRLKASMTFILDGRIWMANSDGASKRMPT